MLFRTLAVLAIAPAYVLSAPHGRGRHQGVVKRCKSKASATPATDIVSATASASDSTVDTVPTSVASIPTSAPTSTSASTKKAKPSSTDDGEAPTSTKKSSSTSTKASSSAAPSSTGKPSSNIPVTNGLFSSLLPMGQGSKLWSTAQGIVNGALSLSMDAFKATSVAKNAPALFSTAPDGSDALEVKFKAGSYTYKGPGPSALSFYGQPLDMSNAKEVTTSYQVFFPEGFNFVKGGKLPGLYGGDNAQVAQSCSGGRRDTRCFSVRFMWRTDGAGELYTYLPDPKLGSQFSGNKALCDAVPNSHCNDVYGASVGRGSFKFATGKWTTIAQRVKLNDAGKSNGELELIVNGESMFTVDGLRFTDSDVARPQGLQAQSFFGGSSPDWASPTDQSLFMRNFNMVITDEF